MSLALFLVWARAGDRFAGQALVPAGFTTYQPVADFRRGGDHVFGGLDVTGQWLPWQGGLTVPPHASAEFRKTYELDFDGPPPGFAELRLWALRPRSVDLAIDLISEQGGSTRLLCTPGVAGGCDLSAMLHPGRWQPFLSTVLLGRLSGAAYDLSPYIRAPGPLTLRVFAINHGATPATVWEEHRLVLAGPFQIAGDARSLYFLPLPVLLTLIGMRVRAPLAMAIGVGLVTAGFLFWPGSAFLPSVQVGAAELFWTCWLAYAATGVIGASRRQVWHSPPFLLALAVYGLTVLALTARLNLIAAGGDGILEPDARNYFAAAQDVTVRSLYEPLGREPLFLVLAHLWFGIAGNTPLALRFLSVAASTLVIPLVYIAGRRAVGGPPAVAACVAMALHPFFQWNAQRALREEISMGLLLALVAIVFAGPPRAWSGWARAAAVGTLTGLLLLLRSDLLAASVVLLGSGFLLQRWPGRHALLAASVAATLFGPFLYSHWQAHGDPFYLTNLQARAFRNYEFHDLPGFPTKADMDRDQFFAGPPITVFQYYVGLHTPEDLVSTTLRGSWRIVKSVAHHTLPGAGQEARLAFIVVLIAAGLLALLRSYRHLALLGALLMLQYAFLHVKAARYGQVDPYGGIDPRLFMVGFPFLLLCVAALPGTAVSLIHWLNRHMVRYVGYRQLMRRFPVGMVRRQILLRFPNAT